VGNIVWTLAAIVLGIMIFKVGLGMIRSLGSLPPEPPPEGEMRKVNLRYRCSLCGAEVRMTTAISDVPEPPRHCMEDMDLVPAKFD
jgi:hypothetical protein